MEQRVSVSRAAPTIQQSNNPTIRLRSERLDLDNAEGARVAVSGETEQPLGAVLANFEMLYRRIVNPEASPTRAMRWCFETCSLARLPNNFCRNAAKPEP